ncbi:hypothetical protein ACQP2E_16115 [Actinoplanes sp. CA-015351]|uniref:hypothetical protein n=1 Tax=Actinoplanes sp. CA-015351 TaxID=3239897 RepID=UPI003D969D84
MIRRVAVLAILLALIPAMPASAARTSLRAADPSVLRVVSTYIGVQPLGGGIAVRQASSPDALATAYAWENRYWHTGTFAWWGNRPVLGVLGLRAADR